MAKSSVKDANDEITAHKICTFLQTNNISNEIFLEILSEIKDKHGYKRLKQMVMDLISTHKNVLHNPATSRANRAAIINEVCMIAFTIDTIFPSVLRMKVQQEFPKLINDILYELKDEKKIDNFVPFTKTQSSASGAVESSTKTSLANISSPDSGKAASNQTLSPSTNISVKSPTNKGNMPVKRKSKIKKMPKTDVESVSKDSTVVEALQSIPKDVKEAKVIKNFKKPDKKSKDTKKVDEDESDILSLLSVSSVHTSELSSFDDAISLSSDDEEKGKKKIKLEDLKEIYQNDRISAWCAENFQGSKSRRSSLGTEADDPKVTESIEPKTKVSTITEVEKEPSKEVTKVITPESPPATASTFWTSTPQKVLPPRIRKPNSKYISDTVLNPITAKQHKREIDADLRTITAISPLLTPQKRKRIKSGSSNEDQQTDLPVRNQQVTSSEKNNAVNNVKNANPPSSPNLYKPFTSVLPLTSRRSAAPVTLFSTRGQSLKK